MTNELGDGKLVWRGVGVGVSTKSASQWFYFPFCCPFFERRRSSRGPAEELLALKKPISLTSSLMGSARLRGKMAERRWKTRLA